MKVLVCALLLAAFSAARGADFIIEAPPYTMPKLATAIRVIGPANFSGTLWLSARAGSVSPASIQMKNGTALASVTLEGSGTMTIVVTTNRPGPEQAAGKIEVVPWSPLGFLLSCQRSTGMICHYYDRIYYEPYVANMAAYLLLQSRPEQTAFVRRYIAWYLRHLNRPDIYGLPGSMYNYTVTNFNEVIERNYDSSDATAGLFLATVWEYYLATKDSAFLEPNLPGLRTVAAAALGTQDADGLTWAKPNYKVKYLEDQCETWTGLRLFAQLLHALGQPDWQKYQQAADGMRAGIEKLWDVTQANCYFWAKEQNGHLLRNDWSKLVPDGQEQIWTILFGINPPGSARAAVIWHKFAQSFPNWPAGNQPGTSFALVSAIMQNSVPVSYRRKLAADFESQRYRWPFTVDSAAQMLAIDRQLQDPLVDMRFGPDVIHVHLVGGLPLPVATITNWVGRAAVAVSNYLGGFPVSNLVLFIQPGADEPIADGVTYGASKIEVHLGDNATPRDLLDDWILTHEMFHLAFPTLNRRYLWMMEGLSDYLEPIARARAGQISAAAAWREFAQGLWQGLPAPGQGGLDDSPTRERIYWGGNLFWLLADVRIREATHNQRSVDNAIRAILNQGGNGGAHWSIDRAIRVGDESTGTKVLRDLYNEIGRRRGNVDLPALWQSLGVIYHHGEVTFDSSAPLADIRASITAPSKQPKNARTMPKNGF